MFKVLHSGKRKKKQWKRMVTKVTYVGPSFTRKPPKYERFIRPSGKHSKLNQAIALFFPEFPIGVLWSLLGTADLTFRAACRPANEQGTCDSPRAQVYILPEHSRRQEESQRHLVHTIRSDYKGDCN